MSQAQQNNNTVSSVYAKTKTVYAMLFFLFGSFDFLIFLISTYKAIPDRLFSPDHGLGLRLSALHEPFYFERLITTVCLILTACLLLNTPNRVNQLSIVKEYPTLAMLFCFFGVVHINVLLSGSKHLASKILNAFERYVFSLPQCVTNQSIQYSSHVLSK